jgi:DnaJ-class molecular chaperone
MKAAKRRKLSPAGACSHCGQLVGTSWEAAGTCDLCGAVMDQSYRLAPMEECPACDGTGADLAVTGPAHCGPCKGWGWRVARHDLAVP